MTAIEEIQFPMCKDYTLGTKCILYIDLYIYIFIFGSLAKKMKTPNLGLFVFSLIIEFHPLKFMKNSAPIWWVVGMFYTQ